MLKNENVQVMLQSNNDTLQPNKHPDLLIAEQLMMVYIFVFESSVNHEVSYQVFCSLKLQIFWVKLQLFRFYANSSQEGFLNSCF